MQLFSPRIRLSDSISSALLQGSEPHQMGPTSESIAPDEVNFVSSWLWVLIQ